MKPPTATFANEMAEEHARLLPGNIDRCEVERKASRELKHAVGDTVRVCIAGGPNRSPTWAKAVMLEAWQYLDIWVVRVRFEDGVVRKVEAGRIKAAKQ